MQTIKKPISDTILLEEVITVDNELADQEHTPQSLKRAHRTLINICRIALRRKCTVRNLRAPEDGDLADVLEFIQIGIEDLTHNFSQTKAIQRRLQKVLRILEKNRIEVTSPEVSELTIDTGNPFDFGSVGLFTSNSKVFVITNSSTTTRATITNLTLSAHPFFANTFTSTCTTGLVIAAGDSCAITIDFTAQFTGSFSDSFSIDYDNGQSFVKLTQQLLRAGQ